MRPSCIPMVTALCVLPCLALAQQPAPRAIQLPDTMGANFSVADTATGTSLPTDYDFLVGAWSFRFHDVSTVEPCTPPRPQSVP